MKTYCERLLLMKTTSGSPRQSPSSKGVAQRNDYEVGEWRECAESAEDVAKRTASSFSGRLIVTAASHDGDPLLQREGLQTQGYILDRLPHALRGVRARRRCDLVR